MALKIRRGTQAQRLNIVPAEGELIYDTTQNKLYIGNGSTSGGTEVVGGVIGGNLGSNVNLGGYDITGTGNINITGTITASGTITGNGDLVLGNADTDNVQFGADINSNIVPNSGSLTIGTSAKPWNTTFTQNISNDSNPVDVLSVLRSNANIIPNTTGTLSVGTVSSRFNEMHSVNFYTQNIRVFENNIVSTVSNEDIILETLGTGSVVSPRSNVTDVLDLGSITTNLIQMAGSIVNPDTTTRNGSIKYNFNESTGRFSVADQGILRTYTQLVSNTPEDVTLVQFTIDPNDVDDIDAYEITVRFRNSAGSQIVKLIGTYFNTTTGIQQIDQAVAGTAPISSISSNVTGGIFQILATTNSSTAAGSVMTYQIKVTTFNTII